MNVSLDFPLDSSPSRWREVLARLEKWEPSTRPALLHRLTDLNPPDEEPWTQAREDEALTRLAANTQFTWETAAAQESGLGVSLRGLRSYVEVSARVKRPPNPVARVADLLHSLEGGLFPRLAMAWAPDTDDDELLMQGLHRLADVPPLLFLDGAIVDGLGARAALAEAAPSSAVGGGLLLAIADPWKKDAEGKKRRRAVAVALGITRGTPLCLV